MRFQLSIRKATITLDHLLLLTVQVYNTEDRDMWTLEKNTNDLRKLHSSLKKLDFNLPKFVSRGWFERDTPASTARRVEEMDRYLCELSAVNEVEETEAFIAFIKTDDLESTRSDPQEKVNRHRLPVPRPRHLHSLPALYTDIILI